MLRKLAKKKRIKQTSNKASEVNRLLKDIQVEQNKAEEGLDSLESKLNRFDRFVEFGKIINQSIDYRKINKQAVLKLRELLDCKSVIMYRADNVSNELYFDPHIDKTIYKMREDVKEIRFKIDEHSLAGACAHFLATLHIQDVNTDIRFRRGIGSYRDFKFKDMLLTPLVSEGIIYGVIQAGNSNREDGFNQEDIHFIEAVAGQMTIAMKNLKLYEDLHNQFVQTVEALADAIGKKDRYTGGHTKRVGVFAEMIAREMDLPASTWRDLRLSGVLHDIGKIGIEDKILKKRAPLTKEEYEIMKDHPRLGFEILKNIDSLKEVVKGVAYHHERPDGQGYPFGLKNKDIPLIARIISVSDTFDAMISTRPYRKGLPPMVAYHEIRKYRGTQFDDEVVDAFVKGFKKSSMYRPEEDEYETHEQESNEVVEEAVVAHKKVS